MPKSNIIIYITLVLIASVGASLARRYINDDADGYFLLAFAILLIVVALIKNIINKK